MYIFNLNKYNFMINIETKEGTQSSKTTFNRYGSTDTSVTNSK